MGLNWAQAIAGGLAGAAGAGADHADQLLREEAEARMADRKLDLQQRLVAADEALKNRAAERFGNAVRAKIGEEVPMEAPSVEQTGLTRASEVEAKTATGESVNLGFTDPEQAKATMEKALADPSTPAETKEYLRTALANIDKQVAKQGDANAASVAGKTRPRTWAEAVREARVDLGMQGDYSAVAMGDTMFGSDVKDEAAEMRLRATERIKDKEIKSREKIAADNVAQRDRATAQQAEASANRLEVLLARRDGGNGSAGGGAGTALRQNVALLQELGYKPEQIEKFIFEKKEVSTEDIAAKLMSADPMLTPEDAAQKAVALKRSINAAGAPAPAPAAAGGAKRLKYNPATGKVE